MAVQEVTEYDKRIERELSPEAYAMKQVRTIGISLLGVAVGAGLGHLAKRAGGMKLLEGVMGRQVKNSVPELSLEKEARLEDNVKNLLEQYPNILEYAGGFLGLVGSGMFQEYEHWHKEMSAKLAVDEINRDIAQARIRTNPDLLAENKMLRQILNDQDKQLAAAGKPTNKVQAADAQAMSTVMEAMQQGRNA